MTHDVQHSAARASVPTDQPYDADPAPAGGSGTTARKRPWMIAAATGVAGVVAGGVLGATLSSAGADTTQQNGPGQFGGTGQQGGPPGMQGGTQQAPPGSTSQGSTGQGSTGQGSTGQGSTGQGSTGTGSSSSGSTT